ncbi:MAG: replicative DNA helicase [Deltaproteobacteria bacterium]|nr:MAG: replicative DNA helicase [Deltaproteobacteria bacterium]
MNSHHTIFPFESFTENIKSQLKHLENKKHTIELSIPQSLDAERGILCSLLIDTEAFEIASKFGIKSDDFYHPSHQIIFSAISSAYYNNKPINTVTIVDELIQLQKLDTIGGPSFIAHLESLFPSSAHIKTYIKIVKDKSILRKLILTASKIAQTAYSQKEKIPHILDAAEQAILKIRDDSPQKEMIPMNELINIVLDKIEVSYDNEIEILGLASGFESIDKTTGGFQPGEFIVIAARPSMGKTALTLNMATHIAMHNQIPVVMFSLEMSADQLVFRILSAESRVDLSRLKTGLINAEEFSDFIGSTSFLSRAPLFIDDSPTLSIAELRNKCRRLALHHHIKLIIVDYLQLMDGPPGIENKTIEVGEISKGLKSIARELKIPVIALSQLNRSVESRLDKRPLMSDLRESGAIEQDADLIVFLYREDYYTKENTPEEKIGMTEIIIAKNRNGPTGISSLKFLSNITKFVNIDEDNFDEEEGDFHEMHPEIVKQTDDIDHEYKKPEFDYEKNINYFKNKQRNQHLHY